MMVLKASKQEGASSDFIKWSLVLIIILAGLISNHYYSDFSLLIRLAGWMAIVGGAGFLASQTVKGRWVMAFVRDSRMELRKVIWPTREETTQTTLIVAVMVVILAL